MQKFKHGDFVRVAKDLGPSMRHFTSDCDAVVCYSYADKYGGSDTKKYSIHIKGCGESAWYYEDQLEIVEPNRSDLLAIWKAEQDAECTKKSNLDWIFKNGNAVLEHPHGASLRALAACFGLNNLWGSQGEGITYFANSIATLNLAEPFLKSGDKESWLNFCEAIKAKGQVT